jgi:hypothetical protein
MIRSVLLASLIFLPPIAADARQIYFDGRVSGQSKWLGEHDSAFGRSGDLIILDENIGKVFILAPSSVDLPILRSEDGGRQTLLRVRVGRIQAKVRHFTNPNSYFSIVNYTRTASIVAKGTEFSVLVGDEIIVGVYESSVIISSGDASKVVTTGNAAIAKEGQAPIVFPIDFMLTVQSQRVSRLFNKNIVVGQLAQGNIVEVDDGTVEQQGNQFRIVTPHNYYRIVNPGGTQRVILFNGVRPFHE